MALAIRRLRKERGWTLEDLAAKVSISSSYLSQLERGANKKQPGAKLLGKFAHAFGCTESDLFDDPAMTPEVKDVIEDLIHLPPHLQGAVRQLTKTLRADYEQEHGSTQLRPSDHSPASASDRR